MTAYTLFHLGQVFAQNIETLLVTRFFSGFFAVAPPTNFGGINFILSWFRESFPWLRNFQVSLQISGRLQIVDLQWVSSQPVFLLVPCLVPLCLVSFSTVALPGDGFSGSWRYSPGSVPWLSCPRSLKLMHPSFSWRRHGDWEHQIQSKIGICMRGLRRRIGHSKLLSVVRFFGLSRCLRWNRFFCWPPSTPPLFMDLSMFVGNISIQKIRRTHTPSL